MTFLDNGEAVFTWQRNDAKLSRLRMRTLSAAGTWGRTVTLLASRRALFPEVAFAPDGDAVLGWQRTDGRHRDGTNARVQVRSRSAAGTVGATITLSSPGGGLDRQQLAVGANGSAIVTWRRQEGNQFRIQGAAGP